MFGHISEKGYLPFKRMLHDINKFLKLLPSPHSSVSALGSIILNMSIVLRGAKKYTRTLFVLRDPNIIHVIYVYKK